jgi:hypothetical protein
MKISKKAKVKIVDGIEAVFDQLPQLDRFPYHIKRQAAEIAASAGAEYLESSPTRYVPRGAILDKRSVKRMG